MIYWQLFSEFFMVGALSFGGGMGMISLIREAVLTHGWLTEEKLMSFIAVAESTPGPIAVNMATFVGSSQAGMLGSFLATLGVVTPAFAIILLIASLLKNLTKYKGVAAFLSGVRPCVVGMILATAVTMAASAFFGNGKGADVRGIALFAGLWGIHILWKKKKNGPPPLVMMIVLSAVMGTVLW